MADESKCMLIEAGAKDAPYVIEYGILDRLGELSLPFCKGGRAVIVTDKNVACFYKGRCLNSLADVGIDASSVTIKPGEKSKSWDTLPRLFDAFLDNNITRDDLIIALGGGVVGDLTGLSAALFLRGVHFIQVPTTLLAQTDSAIGGKTGVNLTEGKNLAGCFYQPDLIIADPACLETLPERELYGGMAEVIKYGAVLDGELFLKIQDIGTNIFKDIEFLTDIISRCARLKGDIVEKDETDKGIRRILNFGHTIGHAIENVRGFGTFHHGEAVAEGMVFSAKWGEKMGITKKGTALQIVKSLNRFSLCGEQLRLNTDELMSAVINDKKRSGDMISFVFLEEVGKAIIKNVTLDELERGLLTFYGG